MLFAVLSAAMLSNAQEWSNYPIPADPGAGKKWVIQSNVSDDFNYTFNEESTKANFGDDKWYNFYHNAWDGPGTTYWQHNHVSVNGDNLVIRASRNTSTTKMGVPGINTGCITSNSKVIYPVFIEASISVSDITLASDIWLLSGDDTQEIDMIECYGGEDNNNAYYAQFIHLSHHSFIRDPFTDYQPKDAYSWWPKSGVTSWGDYCWNSGTRRYVRIGMNWKSPFHFEYYIDGELERVVYQNAFASKRDGTWYYTYPTMSNDVLVFDANGNQVVKQYATSAQYSFATLEAASKASSVNAIDAYYFQYGYGMHKEMDIIINMESQNWHVSAGRTPSDADLSDASKNKMLVDWIRVYKPEDISTASSVTIEAESFTNTGGSYNDAPSGGTGYGVNNAGSIINYVNSGDWAEYSISIPEEGTYEINYQIAAPATGATIHFGMGTEIWNTTDVPNTGGWGSYQTLKASSVANFTAGTHLIRISAGGNTWAWNLNNFTLTKVTALKSSSIKDDMQEKGEEMNDMIFPNPATGYIYVHIEDLVNTQLLSKIFDTAGKVMLTQHIPTNTKYQLDISKLTKGVYFIEIENHKISKLIVQ